VCGRISVVTLLARFVSYFLLFFFFSASNNMIIKYGGMGRAVGA
jgi:hypothetical protein